jgi:hypothetical protein
MAYIAECRVNGQPNRKTIGKCSLLTPEEARKQARKILGEMLAGRLELQAKACAPKLSEVMERFFKTRKLRSSSVRHYKSVIYRCLSDWLEIRIDKISKEMVLQRHKQLTKYRWTGAGKQSARTLNLFFQGVVAKNTLWTQHT